MRSIHGIFLYNRNMPCACEKPLPDYPESDHWGPIVWTILHALAEKAGKTVTRSFHDDERRQWINLLTILPKMIPCAMCRKHAEEWLLANPIQGIKTLPDDEFPPWIISWVYRFHESVNARVGKPSFDFALLSSTYKSVSVASALKALKPFIETAIRLSGITLMPWQKWVSYVRMLSSFYGI